jgi:hypothetical protein
MPRLPRSTSLTFALVFGFLSVLTIFGASSGGLKADTHAVPATYATTNTNRLSENHGRMPYSEAENLQGDIGARGLENLVYRMGDQWAQVRTEYKRCMLLCRTGYQNCHPTFNAAHIYETQVVAHRRCTRNRDACEQGCSRT